MGTKVNREALLATLARVAPGISKRGTISQSSCYVFREKWISTFNDEICCRTQSDLPADLEVAVRAEPLMKWLELVSEDEVEVWLDGGQFKLRAGRDKCGVRAEAEIVLPVDEVDLPDTWRVLPADFFAGVKQVMGTAGGANDEFMVRCVHLHPDYVEACDRKQATRYAVETGLGAPVLVQAATVAHAVDLGLTKVGETKDWIHFRNKTLIFSCRRHVETYPTDGITRMLAFRGKQFKLPPGAEIAAKLGQVFTADDKDNDRVDVKLAAGKMTVYGQGNHGWASRDIDTTYDGEPVAFRLSPLQLIELVTHHTECEIGPGRIRIVGEHWEYVSVLGKPGEPEKEAVVPVGAGAESDDDGGDDDE